MLAIINRLISYVPWHSFQEICTTSLPGTAGKLTVLGLPRSSSVPFSKTGVTLPLLRSVGTSPDCHSFSKTIHKIQRANVFSLPHEPGDLCSSTWAETLKQGHRHHRAQFLSESKNLQTCCFCLYIRDFCRCSFSLCFFLPTAGEELLPDYRCSRYQTHRDSQQCA